MSKKIKIAVVGAIDAAGTVIYLVHARNGGSRDQPALYALDGGQPWTGDCGA